MRKLKWRRFGDGSDELIIKGAAGPKIDLQITLGGIFDKTKRGFDSTLFLLAGHDSLVNWRTVEYVDYGNKKNVDVLSKNNILSETIAALRERRRCLDETIQKLVELIKEVEQ